MGEVSWTLGVSVMQDINGSELDGRYPYKNVR